MVANTVLNLNVNAQNAADWRNNELQSGSLFVNGSAALGMSRKKHNVFGSLGVNVSRSDMQNMGIWSISPCINMGRAFFRDKVKWTFSAARMLSLDGSGPTSGAFYFRTQCGGTIAKKHQISITGFVMRRQVFRGTVVSSNYGSLEQQIALNYAVNLGFAGK